MIIPLWPKWFKDLYGGELPRTYCCFDTETTGFKKGVDVITEFGHVIVEDGRITSRFNLVVDWRNHKVVPDRWLRERLDYVRESMAKNGQHYTTSYERMADEGVEPDRAFDLYYEILQGLIDSDFFFIGHNVAFDEDMIAYNMAGFYKREFSLPDNRVFDTAAIEKGNQIFDQVKAFPVHGECMKAYFKRLGRLGGSGVHSNLGVHCVNKYKLKEKYSLDMTDMHRAEFDARLTHYLFEEFRDLAAKAPPPSSNPVDRLVRPARPPGGKKPVIQIEPFSGTPLYHPPPRPATTPVRRRGQRNR